jgi:hypothetical protein
MAQLRTSHPWNPGFALPQNVLDEPFGQGVLMTAQAPRGTISTLQPSWFQNGNALQAAAIVQRESAMGGLGSLGGDGGYHGSLGHTSLSKTSLSGPSVATPASGASKSPVVVGGGNDPIANFGRQGARAVLSYIRSVPVADRSAAMKAFLDQLDPSLWKSVADKATQLQTSKGFTAPVALEKALQIMLADRLLNQFAKIGKTGQTPQAGLLGLIDPQQRVVALEGCMEALGWGLSSLNPVNVVKSAANVVSSAGSAVKGAATSTVSAVKKATVAVVNAPVKAVKAVGSAVKSAAISVKDAAKSALDKLGDLACKTVGNPATSQVAGAVPHPYAQAAAVGAQVAQGLCGNGTSPVTEQPYTPPPPAPFPMVPVLIGGAAVVGLIAVVALKK